MYHFASRDVYAAVAADERAAATVAANSHGTRADGDFNLAKGGGDSAFHPFQSTEIRTHLIFLIACLGG